MVAARQLSMRPSASPSVTSTSLPVCVVVGGTAQGGSLGWMEGIDCFALHPLPLPYSPPLLLTIDDPRPVLFAVHVLPEHARYAGM